MISRRPRLWPTLPRFTIWSADRLLSISIITHSLEQRADHQARPDDHTFAAQATGQQWWASGILGSMKTDLKILSLAGPLTVVFKASLGSEHLLTYHHTFTFVITKLYNHPQKHRKFLRRSPIQGDSRAGGIAPDLQLKDVLPRFTKEAVKVIDDHGAGTRKNP